MSVDLGRAKEMFPPESGDDFIGEQKQYINDWNQENFFAFKVVYKRHGWIGLSTAKSTWLTITLA